MSELTPRERRHERTRQDILNAAIEIIREEGADKLSLRGVARRIDYSPSGLYEYFANKDALADAICEESDARLRRSMQSVPRDLPPEDYLIAIGEAYLSFARNNPEHYLFLFGNRQVDMPEFDAETHRREYADDPLLIGLDAVARAVDAGVIDPRGQTVLAVTYQFWALLHGMALLQVQYFKAFPLDYKAADTAGIQTFVRGLRP